MFDEGINFLCGFWTLVAQENHEIAVCSLVILKTVRLCVCVCWGVTLRPSLRESNLKKGQLMLYFNLVHLPLHRKHSNEYGSEILLHFPVTVLPVPVVIHHFILTNPYLFIPFSSEDNCFHMTLNFYSLYILPNFQALTVKLSLFTMSFYFLPLPLFIPSTAWCRDYSWTLICHRSAPLTRQLMAAYKVLGKIRVVTSGTLEF